MTSDNDSSLDTRQARWARFRFSIIGHLLSAPPKHGELKSHLEDLSRKQWRHPITGRPISLSFSTLENWLYRARKTHDPVNSLRTKLRTDATSPRKLSESLKRIIEDQYREHPRWSYRLHMDNLAIRVKDMPELGLLPSYSTIYRYMRTQGLHKQKKVKRPHHHYGRKARENEGEPLESREVRSFETEYVHSLWHLDFHHGARKVLGKDGQWHKPFLLGILDDHSRLICHAQWYFDETAESLVHGFKQALQKRCLPRSLMTDNGAAMMSAEFTQGLERLGILHKPTLPYSPYQNAKMEVFWGQVEGRLMSMLEGEEALSLSLLNEATIAWVEYEYHRKIHSEILTTPMDRYLHSPNVGRPCPDSVALNHAFCAEVKRKQRKSDGTFTLHGRRFEVPSQYHHFDVLHVRYMRWDLSRALLVDPQRNACLDALYPLDKSANANALRRPVKNKNINHPSNQASKESASSGIAPLLKKHMAEYAATGLPPAYLPKGGEE
jgi:putative transposase